MIYTYTGTPGSGKSLHVAMDIVKKLKRGGRVIANFPINLEKIKKVKGSFYYKDNSELNVNYLVEFAKINHVMGKENQTLVVIDECQVIFNTREYSRKDRMDWIKFFTQHRKYGYNFILVTQFDRMIDRQIRALFEYEIKHRKINNYGTLGIILSLTFSTWFVAIEKWYGMTGKDSRLGATIFRYKKKYAEIYNSFYKFDEKIENKNLKKPDKIEIIQLTSMGGNRVSGGGPL